MKIYQLEKAVGRKVDSSKMFISVKQWQKNTLIHHTLDGTSRVFENCNVYQSHSKDSWSLGQIQGTLTIIMIYEYDKKNIHQVQKMLVNIIFQTSTNQTI
jgi:hypothetical protein